MIAETRRYSIGRSYSKVMEDTMWGQVDTTFFYQISMLKFPQK